MKCSKSHCFTLYI